MADVASPFFHIVLSRFRKDADPAEVDDFLSSAGDSMAAAPFRVVAMGPDLDLGLTPACDWGYVAEVAEPGVLETWEHQAEHDALREKMLKIRETVLSIQLPLV
ncbi:MAG TPA: hypothetical protein VHB02_14755 [Acidimicrobiales bacterium]|nr:hypothetical protein [Acidimicrobiales bacterium]